MSDRVFARRFSDRGSFWCICAAALSALCLYVFIKIHKAQLWPAAGALWLALCVLAALLSFASRRTKLIRSRRVRLAADWAGSLWFVFAIWSFVLLFALGMANRIFAIGISPNVRLAASFAVSFCLVAAGVHSALNVCVTRLKIATDKLPQDLQKLRIVQLTDLHLGPLSGASQLARILRRVREANPDMVVVTGDVTDGSLAGRTRETAMFRRIRPKYGFFAVTGNHDFYDDIEESLKFMRMSGMRVLRGEAVESGGIIVEGVDDADHLVRDKWGLSRSQTVIVNTKSRHRDKFILLLRHRPVVEIGTESFFDLQLSGHTHGGQLFPLFSSRLFIRGHSRGLKKLKRGSAIYTSNGTGYVGPPVRLFAPPEIVVVDLVRRDSGDASER